MYIWETKQYIHWMTQKACGEGFFVCGGEGGHVSVVTAVSVVEDVVKCTDIPTDKNKFKKIIQS